MEGMRTFTHARPRDGFHGELLHMQGPETVSMVNFHTCKVQTRFPWWTFTHARPRGGFHGELSHMQENEGSILARILVLFDMSILVLVRIYGMWNMTHDSYLLFFPHRTVRMWTLRMNEGELPCHCFHYLCVAINIKLIDWFVPFTRGITGISHVSSDRIRKKNANLQHEAWKSACPRVSVGELNKGEWPSNCMLSTCPFLMCKGLFISTMCNLLD